MGACLRSRKLKRKLSTGGGHCRVTVCYHSETAGHSWYESLVTRPTLANCTRLVEDLQTLLLMTNLLLTKNTVRAVIRHCPSAQTLKPNIYVNCQTSKKQMTLKKFLNDSLSTNIKNPRILIPGQILNHNKLKSCCKHDAKRISKLKLRIPALSFGGRDKKRENRGPKTTNKTKIKTKKNQLLFATQTRGRHCRVTLCYHSETAGHSWYESLVTRPILANCTRLVEDLQTLPLMTNPLPTKNSVRAVSKHCPSTQTLTLNICVNCQISKKQMTLKKYLTSCLSETLPNSSVLNKQTLLKQEWTIETDLLKNTIVTFADSYLRANIEFWNKACTRGKYYSYTKLYFVLFVFIYVYSHMYVRHVLAVALASLP